tara:strand:- start:452 stop:691 length:240 start_codon:yes stop_codon:yes gene_type:complete
MATNVLEMAEAHLINIQREIQKLEQSKNELQVEIERLQEYFNEAIGVVETAKSDAQAALVSPTTSPSTEQEFPFQSVTS